MILGVLFLAVFGGALLWDALGQPTRLHHLERRFEWFGRFRKRQPDAADKTSHIDRADGDDAP